ncbi:uncharacterized protein HMPREF1541_11031 [Cyphellophora europaea CBS 101466]|uniref:Uncharacterized protein n=1 Tax=Cyphellophora europaea (strain CBS 101466) TaxID=1220924 RepID=W2S5N1_CYPE1|nr:uncharacterized protein HMPREF1541_11031 [Cyphellophora europaea CBS 101466]ETN43900.1 hypothetical protein HMPREF1541_11031 [Cyphellophora europaea CBS 101466]
MDPSVWNSDAALEWHQVYTEWNDLRGNYFNSVIQAADTLRRLSRRMAALQRSSRMTNAQMNSRYMTLCQQMGYEEMTRDLVLQDGKGLFSADERAWMSFDELVDRYANFEAWRRQNPINGNGNSNQVNNGIGRVRSNEPTPPRTTSLDPNPRSMTLPERNKSIDTNRHAQPEYEQAPAYSEEPGYDHYGQDEKRQPEVQTQSPSLHQRRALQRSGTQRAFDFIARSSVAPSIPDINVPYNDDPLAPPPPLLSPRQIKDKRSSRKSMRYDTEEFMS